MTNNKYVDYNKLALMRGDGLHLYGDYYIKHPTLQDIVDLQGIEGDNLYNIYVSMFTLTAVDVADVLWVEEKIWYEDIANYPFFIQRMVTGGKDINVYKVYPDGRKSIPVKTKMLSKDASNALAFFTGVEGDYVLGIDNNKNTILANVHRENDSLCYYYVDNDFIFKEHFYEIGRRFIEYINWEHKEEPMVTKVKTKSGKRWTLENLYVNRMDDLKKMRKPNVTLDSIVSSLICKGIGSDIWSMPIYLIYDMYYRCVQFDSYNTSVRMATSGMLDTKKHPIKWDKVNWSRRLN